MKNLESGKLSNVDADVEELADATSTVDGGAAVVEAVRLELSLLE